MWSFRWSAGLCTLIAAATTAHSQDHTDSGQDWQQRAVRYINQIEDEKALGRALYEFTPVRLLVGDFAGASIDARRISNPQLRCYAHYQVGRYVKALGDFDGAIAEVIAARASALERGFSYAHVDACLDIADSIDMAKSYVSSALDRNASQSSYGYGTLVGALAKRGFFEEALNIVERQPRILRPRFVAKMAQATAQRAEISRTEKLLERIPDTTAKDNVLVALIRALSLRGRTDDAKPFVQRVHASIARHHAERITGTLGGKSVNELTIDDLRNRIAEAESQKIRQELNRSLLMLQLTQKDIAGAEATIKTMVDLITTAGFGDETSKFGNTTDASRIALVEVNYLQIAAIYTERGETQKARTALERAKKAVANMPDSSGMGKMMVVPGLLTTQLRMGDIDSVRQSVRTLRPVFWQQTAPALVKAFLDENDPETAVFIAESLLKENGAGGAGIISIFVTAGQFDRARALLEKVRIDSHIGHEACRLAGSTMFQLGHTDLLRQWVDELSPGVSAHLCIGAARAAFSFLLAPTTPEERALISFLTIDEELPAGFSREQKPWPLPGLIRHTALPQTAETLQRHRSGPPPRLSSAAKTVFVSGEETDIDVYVWELRDKATAAQTVDEIHFERFADRYLQKGRYVIFVDSGWGVNRIAAGDRILAILRDRKLPGSE